MDGSYMRTHRYAPVRNNDDIHASLKVEDIIGIQLKNQIIASFFQTSSLPFNPVLPTPTR